MKRSILFCGLSLILLAACTKEKKNVGCIKGKLIYVGMSCHKKWGVQLLSGPVIGEKYGEYDNVIEVYNIPEQVYQEHLNIAMNDTIEFRFRDIKPADIGEYNKCPTNEAVLNISNVKKAFVSVCN